MTMLVMFSGGLDSTASLLYALRESDEPILVCHVKIVVRNIGPQRADLDTIAAGKILKYLKKQEREFEYTEICVDLTNHIDTQANERWMWMWAIFNCLSARLDIMRVALGWPSDDYSWNSVASHYEFFMWVAKRYSLRQMEPEWYIPFLNKTRADELAYIGPTLAGMTWSCNQPLFDLDPPGECGECLSCKQLILARKQYLDSL